MIAFFRLQSLLLKLPYDIAGEVWQVSNHHLMSAWALGDPDGTLGFHAPICPWTIAGLPVVV